MKVYKFTGARAPLTVDAKRYSPAQLSIADSLANWIQASYMPKGALGDVIRNVSEKLGLYNKNDAALPQTSGATRRLTPSSNTTPTATYSPVWVSRPRQKGPLRIGTTSPLSKIKVSK